MKEFKKVIDIHGFSPGSWHSRDWEMTVKCANKDCFLYSYNGT